MSREILNPKTLLVCSILLLSIIIINSHSINLLSSFYYHADQNNNYFNHHYHLAYAASTSSAARSFTVVIPKGSANPEVDITKLGPRQWYVPRQITIHTNDTLTWKNSDTEVHTVTSGISAGIESLMNNKRGTPNGILRTSNMSSNTSKSNSTYIDQKMRKSDNFYVHKI